MKGNYALAWRHAIWDNEKHKSPRFFRFYIMIDTLQKRIDDVIRNIDEVGSQGDLAAIFDTLRPLIIEVDEHIRHTVFGDENRGQKETWLRVQKLVLRAAARLADKIESNDVFSQLVEGFDAAPSLKEDFLRAYIDICQPLVRGVHRVMRVMPDFSPELP
ncbi:MAG TPA: hypothetical protein VMV79_07990 [Alphaproteobacteria bacterium]|nr:hypothetical protein [Alphaproteobacteria bacterium]